MTGLFRVASPASCLRRRTVAVLGAGIAGLTAAHELVERGFAVTVYEPRGDERAGLGGMPPGAIPPVKLGGLAASQYSTTGPTGGSQAELRPFPSRRGRPPLPARAVAGEHGFRFFPAYYLHIWDMLERIPVYEHASGDMDADLVWRASARTVMENIRRVITQATILRGQPSLIFTREAPRNLAELVSLLGQFRTLGFTPSDVSTFAGRILRYLVTSPLRRASELQNLSAHDYFIGRDAATARRYSYSPQTEALIFDMPKVLAAFDSRWGDARTNISTFMQLLLRMDRWDDKADGVLNGPTTEAWFDHWYRHLAQMGVRFVRAAAERIEAPPVDPRVPPHLRPRVQVVLTDGTRLTPDYVVAAVDAPAAERMTAALRPGTGGAVAGLDGFTTSRPPEKSPLQPASDRRPDRRDPCDMAELGRRPWDRFQTLAGIQYYFDTEFQLVRGHVFYTGTDWGLSSINQHGLWERRPSLARDGYVAVLSVDIGDFNKPSSHLLDEEGRGKAARDCTADEIAAEVWRQIATVITSDVDNIPEATLPWPVWYSLDRNLVMAGPGQGDGRPLRNEAPYLIPIVGDWPNRPGAEPWNPNGTSWTVRPTEDAWRADLTWRHVWQARHGGYQVHHNSLVFAGTWTKTFTRMTTMEAACESARHAVNAILDHYIWVETEGADRREVRTLDWRMPFGFVDQGLSVPVRQPSPAGDYCFVFDLENREPLETRALRNLDSLYCRHALPHPLDAPPTPQPPPTGGSPMTNSSLDYTGQLLSYLQAWRQFLEEASASVAGPPGQPGAWSLPPMPGVTPVPPSAPPPAPLSVPPLPPAPLSNPAGSTMTPDASPVSFPAAPGAAPPGPPVPPIAQIPSPDTADATAAPAEPRQAQLVAPPWLADVEQPQPGPGQPAAVYARPDSSPVPATQGMQPRSAYSWTERAEPAEAQQTAPVSLFAAPAAATPQRPRQTAPVSLFAAPAAATPQRPSRDTPDFVPTDQETLPPENRGFAPTAERPPAEGIAPRFSGGSGAPTAEQPPAERIPPRFSGGSAAQPPIAIDAEIIGGDPAV
jgi:uncharacterized protein with NAD-binding domain and iron-sulfur cluster